MQLLLLSNVIATPIVNFQNREKRLTQLMRYRSQHRTHKKIKNRIINNKNVDANNNPSLPIMSNNINNMRFKQLNNIQQHQQALIHKQGLQTHHQQHLYQHQHQNINGSPWWKNYNPSKPPNYFQVFYYISYCVHRLH